MAYSESSLNPQIIKNENGVRILDPNPLGETVPHEDMFIFIKLEARQKSKSVLTQKSDNGYIFETKIANTINLAAPLDTTVIEGSTLFGGKPNLTTEWTEIGGHNIELYKDKEGFGITNINVKIASQTAPQVVIDFVDVRGATLFEQGSCSPYGLFFNLPYPVFVLTLKGYYGRPVEYYLNLVKFNSRFNSETGNMECRAEFVGYSFAFLSDTIVGYVAASQYLKKETYAPQEKLRKKYVETTKRDGNDLLNFCDNDVIGKGRCYTINDLLFKIKNFEQYIKPDIINSPEFNKLTQLNALKDSYEVYRDHLYDLIRDLSNSKGVEVTPSKAYSSDQQRMLRFNFKDLSILTELLKKGGLLESYFNKTSGILSLDIRITKGLKLSDNEYADSLVSMLTNASATELNGTDSNDSCPGCGKLYNDLKKSSWNNIFPTTNITDISFDNTILPEDNNTKFLDLGFILQNVEAELDKLVGEKTSEGKTDGVITNLKRQVINQINQIVTNALGFYPTIRNIFTILLCNTDAFMSILLEIAERAEKHHQERKSEYRKLVQPQGDGVTAIIGSGTKDSSGDPKVYSWPTYYKRNYESKTNNNGGAKKQGSKEAFPGEDTRFSNWVEVRFVEDFITAFLEYQKDLDILNDEKEGKAGFDNFLPINPLESPVWNPTNALKYFEQTKPISGDKDEESIYTTIAERMFIALDHSMFSPIRLTPDAIDIGKIGNGSWNPIKNNDPNNIALIIGKVEAWNFMNCQEGETGIRVLSSCATEQTKEEFIKNVLGSLNTTYGGVLQSGIKASQLMKDNFLFYDRGWDKNDDYYVFTPKDGILLTHPRIGNTTNAGKIYIQANPYKMPANQLIKIVESKDVGNFEIKIVPEDGDFATVVEEYRTQTEEKTKALKLSTSEFDPQTTSVLDKNNKILSWDDPRLYTTLGAFSTAEVDGTSWWVSKTIGSMPLSNFGLLSYWDYSGQDETFGISFFCGPQEKRKVKVSDLAQGSKQGDSDTVIIGDVLNAGLTDDGDGLASSIINTPLWLDNVNAFRTGSISSKLGLTGGGNGTNLKTPSNFYLKGDQPKNYTTDEIQNRNLAYIYLHTLKNTPLVTRYINNEGEFFSNDEVKENDGSSFIYSLKAFNSIAGVAKVPKAWLLTLGSQLWRWKMFVGTRVDLLTGKRVWNKPLPPKNKINDGFVPTGFDPLAQPGFNSYDNLTLTTQPSESPNTPMTAIRNLPYCLPYNGYTGYLDFIYNTNISTGWASRLQTSSFATQTSFTHGNRRVFDPQDVSSCKLGGPSAGVGVDNSYVYFNYFGIYKNKLGNETLENNIVNKPGAPTTISDAQNMYSWPQLWIAPHHIPYVHPERFFDDEGESSAYVQIFSNNVGYLDYQTLMPASRNGNENYSELIIDLNLRYRSKFLDGNLGMIIQYLPDEVKDEIIEYFDKWCEDTWPNLLKIVDPINFGDGLLSTNYLWDSKTSEEILGNSNNTVALVLRDDKESLKRLMTDEVWILNSTPKIWYGISPPPTIETGYPKSNSFGWEPDGVTTNSDAFFASQKIVEQYLGSFYDELNKQRTKKVEELRKKQQEQEASLGGAIDDADIKLSLYRTFKSITDKWISSNPSGKMFFNVTDNGKGCGKDFGGTRTLAGHFQYVNRVMGDIGNLAVLDITKLNELKDNVKISLYQYLSDILTENEYMFFPLPGYVDFTSQGMRDKDLEDMFKPVFSLDRLSCGPVFLCMYVGGNSRQLKYKGHANCPADLKDLLQLENIDDDSFLTSVTETAPQEIQDPLGTNPDGTQNDPFAGFTSFKIVYGLENQNHFKNIQLDQSEFSETAESLLVIDKLSQQGGTDQTTKGQNLNSAYLTRSYTCQVESLGNMMIQPMTYFDLIGVPMFNGAYLITTVEHNFKPNHATTTFKGVRQPRMTIPLVTDAALTMNMSVKEGFKKSDGTGKSLTALGGGDGTTYKSTTGSRTSIPTGSYEPIIRTLIENGATNGNVVAGNNTLKPIPPIVGINNEKLNNKDENVLITEATDSLVLMMNDWVDWMKSEGFKGSKNNRNIYGGITSVFRDYEKQVQIKNQFGTGAATPGTSNHGWAIAVDIQMYTKEGDIIRNLKNTPKNFDLEYNPSLKWLLDNSYSYGWILPSTLRDGPALEEHWHFEYHGTAAKCLVNKNPTTYGYTISVNKSDKPVVVNPKSKDGSRAIYVDCDKKTVNTGDGTSLNQPTPSDNKCNTSYPNLPWVEYKSTKLPYKDAKKYLSKATDEATAKSVFAILWAEAAKSKNEPAFISSGNNNYAGVQSDGDWGDNQRTGNEDRYPFFSSQYCRKDSGNQYRAFASFENNEKFLDFMIDRVKKKGFNSSNADDWTNTYVQSWWSPGLKSKNGGVDAKTKIYKNSDKTWVDFRDNIKVGGETFDSKKSIFITAINRWDNLV